MGRPATGLPTVGEYLEQTGLTRDEMRARLEQSGFAGARLNPAKQIPQKWASTLGLAAAEPDDSSPGPDAANLPPGRAGERSPTQPEGAKVAPLPVAIGQVAAERIASTYGLIGGVASMAAGNVKVAQVVDAYSTPIGEAWVRAAEENEFARRVVQLMSAGGATGELVTMHLVLVGGLLYVTGRAPAFAGLYSRRFGPPPPVTPTTEPPRAGAGDEAADAAVGDAPSAAAA